MPFMYLKRTSDSLYDFLLVCGISKLSSSIHLKDGKTYVVAVCVSLVFDSVKREASERSKTG